MRKGLLWGAVVVVSLVVLSLGYCAFAYQAVMQVDSAKGIDEERFVRINGIDQWVQIRGDDRNNPVILWLNGGPGFSTIPNTILFRDWERQFTIVMWDQRGEGKTFDRAGTHEGPMTIAQMTSDGIVVAEYLRARLHKNKIILLGLSWGSLMGVHMAQARPDLFSVYVGTGQVVNLERSSEVAYPLLLAHARAIGNAQAVAELKAAGPPPYPAQGLKKWTWVKWANALDPGTEPTHLSPAIALWLLRTLVSQIGLPMGLPPGAIFSQQAMWEEILRDDLGKNARFAVPVVIVQGTEDRVAVSALAHAYFDRITAPSKQFIPIAGGGHSALFSSRQTFLHILVTKVRPLALAMEKRA
jgi:pimeloyl-ACP methyl ester carboxylesterase